MFVGELHYRDTDSGPPELRPSPTRSKWSNRGPRGYGPTTTEPVDSPSQESRGRGRRVSNKRVTLLVGHYQEHDKREVLSTGPKARRRKNLLRRPRVSLPTSTPEGLRVRLPGPSSRRERRKRTLVARFGLRGPSRWVSLSSRSSPDGERVGSSYTLVRTRGTRSGRHFTSTTAETSVSFSGTLDSHLPLREMVVT